MAQPIPHAPAAPASARRSQSLRALPASDTASRRGFGSVLPTRQRLRLELRGDGVSAVFSADDILGAGARRHGEHRPRARLPAALSDSFADAAAQCLAAAESVIALHRTRLYLDPLDRSGTARGNGLLIEWRQPHGDAPMIESVPLDVFTSGHWLPRPGALPPRHGAAMVELAACLPRLLQPLTALAATHARVRFSMRSFDAPGTG
ncbi:hypothetical protein CMZ84_06225 [Lysobacteraceae bacterium NML93-0399]|nr:hypothetical protein CMZ84_06225 [Xanthomonadaceae bacterium NML93-0399]